jgi:hypothetical protein
VQDTIETFRHETLAHFGLNLLAPSDKAVLLAAIIAAKENLVKTVNMIELRRGEPYPLPLEQGEGAAAQFLTKTGNVLQIVLPDMDAKEQTALRSGMIKAGFLYEGGALLLLFQFYGGDGKPLITFEAPFDMRILPATRRNLHNIKNPEQRLAIDIHAIDEKNILRALRVVTMPPDMTIKFLSAVQDQLAAIDKPGVMAKWMQQEPQDLLKQAESWILGA